MRSFRVPEKLCFRESREAIITPKTVRSTLSSFQFLRSQIRTTLIKAKEGERTDSGKVSDYREAAQQGPG